ncbi:MAG: hypothetical protein M5F18_02365 [Asgard group archaeon]|nr:hypothetical protein [Asgard group archaeon]
MSRFFVYLGRTPQRERERERREREEREKIFSSSLLPLSAQRKNNPHEPIISNFLFATREGGGYYEKKKRRLIKEKESGNGRNVLREDVSIKEQQRSETKEKYRIRFRPKWPPHSF